MDVFEKELLKIVKDGEKSLLLTLKTIRDVETLYTAVASSVLQENYEEAIQNFSLSWNVMVVEMRKDNFLITTPPKTHIICDHLTDYLDLTKKSLSHNSDQHIESAHQKFSQISKRSGYHLKQKSGLKGQMALSRTISHFNAYNSSNYSASGAVKSVNI